MILDTIAVLCTGTFTGAAIYVSMVEHPARVECGPAVAVAEFGPSYRRAAVMQATLAALGGLTAIGAWAQGHGVLMLLGGLLLAAAIPFTLLAIRPTTLQLLDPALEPSSARATALLARWATLHAVRTVASIVAFVLLGAHLALAHCS
jgi:Domain of unknown function (DUF1772)